MTLKDEAWVATQLQRQVASGPCILRYHGGPKDGTDARFGTLITAETIFTEGGGQWYRHRYSVCEPFGESVDGVPVVHLSCASMPYTPPEPSSPNPLFTNRERR